jgi:hypothetical protein
MKVARTRVTLALASAAALVATVGVYAATGAHAASAGCAVNYTISSQWQGGFGANVAITNLGDPVTSWTLKWAFATGQAVTQAWNATVTQSGTAVTATNMSYNGSIATGGSASFGFNGSWTSSNPVPSSFTLNGTTCTGGVTSPTTPASPTTSPTNGPTPTSSPTPTPTGGGTPTSYQGMPNLDPNACHNSGLPRSYGTNFSTPSDPFGQGFQDTTAIGWDGNYWPVFEYLSGSFFARGVGSTYNGLCGAMYSFSAYTYGGSPAAQSVTWTEDSGYLPAMKTSRTSGSVGISIKDFADRVSVNGNPFMLVYVRVSVTNNGSGVVTVPPGGSGPNLLRLTSTSLDAVQPGQTSNHDFVVAVDNFGTGATLPTGTTLSSVAPSYDTAYGQMVAYWNARVAETTTFSLPNVSLPNTGNLANPGTAMANAYRAGTIYNLIMQVGEAQFSGANNYNWILNHDVPGELTAKFETGDFHDAQNLLLTARISQQTNWNEVGANWYWDGVWKTMGAWATYLAKTNDTAFVSQFFHDDASGSSPWGPSLYTIARNRYPSQLASDGTLVANFDNDSTGRWLFSNFSALQMLASYRYIASRIGQSGEASWADGAYTSLLTALNTVVGRNESTNGFSYLPCEVDKPNTANRCNTTNDANWASPGWVGQNQWSTMLAGGTLTGVIGDPGQIDRMYQWGFQRLSAAGYPYPTFGAFTGYSTAYNTAYASDGLYSTNYRDLPITSYAWQIQTTTGGPNAWWEANGSGPSTTNPWIGSHAGPQFGACPYAWPISAQQQGLLQSITAEGLPTNTNTTNTTGTTARPLYIGRGIPNSWITAGQTTSVGNLTNSYNPATGARTTYGVSIAVTKPTTRVITITITGTPPGGPVYIQPPILLTTGVNTVTGGTYDPTTHTVTANTGATTITITLAS